MPLCVRNTFLQVEDLPLEDDNRPGSDPTTSSSSCSSSVSSASAVSSFGSAAKRLPGITRRRARKAFLRFHNQSCLETALRPTTFAAATTSIQGVNTTESEVVDSSNETPVANQKTDVGSADVQLAMYTKVAEQFGNAEANRLVLLSSQRGLSFVELVESLPEEENLRLLSRGSLDHFAGTCKPCVYHVKASDPNSSCLRGFQCRFCHHDQHKREGFTFRKGKRHRERLKHAMKRDSELLALEASPDKSGPSGLSEDAASRRAAAVRASAAALAAELRGSTPTRRHEVVHL